MKKQVQISLDAFDASLKALKIARAVASEIKGMNENKQDVLLCIKEIMVLDVVINEMTLTDRKLKGFKDE